MRKNYTDKTQVCNATYTFNHVYVLLIFLAVLSGCSGGGNADLQSYIREVKARPAGRISPVPEFKPYESFVYNETNLRDPFNVLLNDSEESNASAGALQMRPDINRNKEALEQYPLDTLHFVGHLEKDGERWAIITSPDQLVYRVKTGNHIGTNYGEIVAISETKLDIKEIIEDGIGGWIEREAALTLTEN